MSKYERQGPLRDLTVLEFSHTIMGPCAGLLLADLGADVIKVEPTPHGDKTRYLPGFAAGFFATFNRNKRSIALNLKSEEGQAAIHELVKKADVVLDNYGPGTMEKLACGWDTLKVINPRLIFLSLKGFLKGPLQDRPALDEVVQFQSGLAYMTGPPGQPLRAGASIVDILGAVFGVVAVQAALRERDTTNQGQRVGSSLFESAAFMMASHMAGGVATGQEVPPMTARKGAWGIYDVFHSSEGEPIFIGVTSDAQWVRFCDVFELKELLENPELATNPQRTLARDWLLPQLVKRFSIMDYASIVSRCENAQVSWSPVGRPEDLVTNEQLQAEGGLLSVALSAARGASAVANSTESAHSGSQSDVHMQIPGIPLEFGEDRERLKLYLQPPELGEHSREVLLQAGLEADLIDKLYNQGVLR